MRENPKFNINHRNGLCQRVFDKNADSAESADVPNENLKCVSTPHVSHPRKSPPTQLQKIGSALFYAVCSICIVFVNKSVLTIYHFPSAQILGNGLANKKYSFINSTHDLL